MLPFDHTLPPKLWLSNFSDRFSRSGSHLPQNLARNVMLESSSALSEVTTLERPQPASEAGDGTRTTYLLPDGTPDASVLQDRTPPWLRLSRGATGLIALLAGLFVMFARLPLWHADLWGHLAYGRWIAEHGVPTLEPLLPLQRGVPFLDLAWGSQWGGFLIYQQWGLAGIQAAAALLILGSAGLLSGAVLRRTESLWAALVTCLAFLLLDSQQLLTNLNLMARPQLAGLACFVAVFVLATSPSVSRWKLPLIGLIFVLWGNLHGSFPVGWGVLGLLSVGRYIDFSRRARHVCAGWSDQRFQFLFCATCLSCLGVLVNPYGIGAYGEVLAVASHPNVRDLVEWEPLTLRMMQGQFAAIGAFALACLYRLSPRRVTTGELLLLVVFGVAALWTSRMIVWWAPLAAYYLGLHLAAATGAQFRAARFPVSRTGLNSVVAAGLCWIAFAITPFGGLVLHGPKDVDEMARRFRRSVSPFTPVELTDWLNRNEVPSGQVFNCSEWGDYLLFAGPPQLPLFVYSHVHLTPREVWQDYREISYGLTSEWQTRLDRYGVNSVIMDHRAHGEMIRKLTRDPQWEQVYDDRLGSVFFRRNPL
jgi:hypothetical protein